jgi:hypothetical protein
MLSAACRQIFEEACEEKGNWIDGFVEEAELEFEVEVSGDGIEELGGMVMWQQEGVMDDCAGAGALRGSRSQWRRRKMGMSLKALKR